MGNCAYPFRIPLAQEIEAEIGVVGQLLLPAGAQILCPGNGEQGSVQSEEPGVERLQRSDAVRSEIGKDGILISMASEDPEVGGGRNPTKAG